MFLTPFLARRNPRFLIVRNPSDYDDNFAKPSDPVKVFATLLKSRRSERLPYLSMPRMTELLERSSENAATIHPISILSDSDFSRFPEGAGPNSVPIRRR